MNEIPLVPYRDPPLPNVTLNSIHNFPIVSEQSILDAGLELGIALDYSCKQGRCGKCKATLKQGDTRLLSSQSLEDGIVLGNNDILMCTHTALGDITIEAPVLSSSIRFPRMITPARIDQLDYITPSILRIRVRLPSNHHFNCAPGQYINVSRKSFPKRSYSVFSGPDSDHKLELLIGKLEQGAMSTYWFHQALTNDLLMLDGPYGTFTLRDITPDSKLVFVATGTGIAPIHALLLALSQGILFPKPAHTHLIWGVKDVCDLHSEIGRLVDEYTPIISQPTVSWSGRIGHVQDVFVDLELNHSSAVYACGNFNMVQDIDRLVSQQPYHIPFYSDIFVASGNIRV